MTINIFPASILLCAILLAIAIPVFSTNTVYVRLEYSHAHCPGEPCHPLSHYQQQVNEYFVSDTTAVFVSGTHFLKDLQPLIIQDVDNFTMKGTGDFIHGLENLHESSSQIKCNGTHMSGFKFINVTRVQIQNLTFVCCGQEVVYSNGIRAALAFDTAHNVILSRVTVRNSSGFGLHADQVFGNVQVNESAFLYNTGNKEYHGGNVRFWYEDCPENHNTYLQIELSYFLYGNDASKWLNTGLTLLMNCSLIIVRINNITAVGNEAGNLAINFTDFTSNYHYSEEVPNVIINNSRIADGAGYRGGGLNVWLFIVLNPKEGILCNQTCKNRRIVHISNTQFVGNHAHRVGGALYIRYYETKQIELITREIILQNCTFSGNTVPPSGDGTAMVVVKFKNLGYTLPFSPEFELIVQNCSFYNNSLHEKNDSFIRATVNIFHMERVIFRYCNFTGNNSTALSLVDSNLFLEGNILFDGNRAMNGGALRFCDTSRVYIRKNTHIKFYNNHAKNAGGAIYAQQQCLDMTPPCFFQPIADDFTEVTDLKKWMSLTFVNNTAEYAGSGLYGSTIDNCYTFQRFKYNKRLSSYYSSEIFGAIFHVNDQPGDSPISSDPFGVCLCDESGHNCSIKNYTFPKGIHPGEAFNISAVTVGQRYGVAPAEIRGTATSGPSHSLFKLIKQNQTASNRCVTLTYTLHSKNQQETLQLTVEHSRLGADSFYQNFPPPKVTVSLCPCPCGFTLQHDPPYCDCDQLLVKHKISCNINKQTIQREAPMWIGYHDRKLNGSLSAPKTMFSKAEEFDQYTCQGVVIHLQCPYDYCILMNINISVKSTDEQCAFHRTGTLCGECQDGLSLILGSSKCLHCSNLYLLLLIVFILAGLVLFVFLTISNLTVSEGKIFGLIFYANVVHINRTIFFPSTEANPLAVLIAWLNLDLGIETCFYDGLDAYVKAWLQFVFPIYIWLIAGLTILLSRRYTIAARLSGRNAVKVLATLFILSVAKLVRAIITALAYTVLEYPDGLHVSVWLPDANVKFLQGKHIPLFITAVLFSALVFCFVLMLTFIPCLQKKSDTTVLFWVNKIKPLFDAYTSPYKDRYRFWPGLLLLLLTILVFIFSLNDLDRPFMKLMFTAISCFIVVTLAWALRGVYRKWPLDIIESSCILNLGLLAVITNYILNDGNNQITQGAIVNVSVGTVFVLLIAVLGYQVYKQLSTSMFCHRFVLALSLQTDEPSPELGPQEANTMTEQLLPPVIHFDKYREAIFEYEDQSTKL